MAIETISKQTADSSTFEAGLSAIFKPSAEYHEDNLEPVISEQTADSSTFEAGLSAIFKPTGEDFNDNREPAISEQTLSNNNAVVRFALFAGM